MDLKWFSYKIEYIDITNERQVNICVSQTPSSKSLLGSMVVKICDV